jgi:predicted MFS family arabinose efflux permease
MSSQSTLTSEHTVGAHDAYKLGGAYAWVVWCLATLFVVYLFSVQTGYAVVNPSIQKDVGLSVSQVATVAAVYTWVFAIFQFFGGALLDRLGSRMVLPASIALVTLGVFIFANARSFEMLLLSQFVLALGSCTGFVGAGYLGGKWFGMALFSFMFGLVQFVAAFTSAFTQNLFDFALKHVEWRPLFNYVGFAGIALLVAGALYIRDREPPVHSDQEGGPAGFVKSVIQKLVEVARIGHVWMASVIGAILFGTMLAFGVVWMPKLLQVHGLSPTIANLGASMMWLGLAVGSIIVVRWSDHIQSRRLPIILGTIVQILTLVALLYLGQVGPAFALTMCFTFGFANAAHMLAFSTAGDVVKPEQIGTSAAIVNGLMFIAGGLFIGAPAGRVATAQQAGEVGLQVAQYAALPLVVSLIAALVLCFFMKETFPKNQAA